MGTEHRHAYRPIGHCRHFDGAVVREHRVYRCLFCRGYAHSRTPLRTLGRWRSAGACPVSLQQSEVETWERHYRERVATP